ncbi:MAG TPA: cytochrome c [Thermopetrobacter sp.]|nr:cytochrome c [Thermopetrobacter sp.]
MWKWIETAALAAVLFATPALAGIGTPATEAEIAALDRDVRADGAGLPPGKGAVEQGAAIYAEKCAACHGEFGEGAGRMPALIGGEDSLRGDRPRRTVGSFWPYAPTLFDYIRRAMPLGHGNTLSDDETYALTAHILELNGIVTGDFIADMHTLPRVRMPNQAGFRRRPPPRRAVPRCMRQCRKTPARIIRRATRRGDEP